MIKKIKITKLHKTIPIGFELELERMTVLTGENNTGKTNFIQAITIKKDAEFLNAEFFDNKNNPVVPTIVYIAAENINPSDSEFKSTAKATGLIKNLSELFANLEVKFELTKKAEIFGEIKNLINKTNENLKSFTGNNKHEIKLDLNEGELDAASIIQTIIEDIMGNEGGKEMKIDNLGQGTQRIIVASILKAYVDILVERGKHTENPILILFEEPEIYLHPKLKKSLNATLKRISEQDKHQVIITTHDPYFAYTNLKEEGSVIYSFFRNGNNSTDKKEPDVIFGIEDELLHIHLFNRVLRKIRAEQKINLEKMDEASPLNIYLLKYSDGEVRDNIYPSGKINKLALPLHIRHVIHHPHDEKNKFSNEELEKSINILNKILLI
ncbi:MAG: AAA family ATPase [bacterium]|nr:AAA family ATPase [bacterium]